MDVVRYACCIGVVFNGSSFRKFWSEATPSKSVLTWLTISIRVQLVQIEIGQ
jgi:hypothetical protein